MASHYHSPYHQSYSAIDDHHHHQHRQQPPNNYYGHRRSSRLDDGSVSSRERFNSGCSRNFDQAPSIHHCKSRDHLCDSSNVEDCSERSFQLGTDRIERDWGDSMSLSCRGGASMLRPRESYESSLNSLSSRHSQTSMTNATFKPRRTEYDDECCNYARRATNDSCGSGDTGSTAPSSYCESSLNTSRSHCNNFSQRRASMTNRYNVDLGERARPSRPDHINSFLSSDSRGSAHSRRSRHSLLQNSDHDGRFSSGASVSSSVCSRSAPARRTRIPREPSLYHQGSSHSNGSSRRTFSYSRQRQQQRPCAEGSECRHHSMPPEHVEIVLDHCAPRPRNRRASCSDVPKQDTMVEIAPGVQAPLRGTQETYKAVTKDFYANISCFGCSLELCCIADVSYVVCPECKVISPLEGTTFEGKEIRRRGLGLGFTYESLFQMQTEIMKDRKSRD